MKNTLLAVACLFVLSAAFGARAEDAPEPKVYPECTVCGGTGILKKIPGKYPGFKCPMCDGEGKMRRPRTFFGRDIPSGYHLCGFCQGKGAPEWVACDKCKRSEVSGILRSSMGYRLCEGCSGFGELPVATCKACKGIGYVKD